MRSTAGGFFWGSCNWSSLYSYQHISRDCRNVKATTKKAGADSQVLEVTAIHQCRAPYCSRLGLWYGQNRINEMKNRQCMTLAACVHFDYLQSLNLVKWRIRSKINQWSYTLRGDDYWIKKIMNWLGRRIQVLRRQIWLRQDSMALQRLERSFQKAKLNSSSASTWNQLAKYILLPRTES